MELNLRRKAKWRFPKLHYAELYVPMLPDTVWSADFVSDALMNSRRFRTFNVTDDFNREAIHIEIDTSITSAPDVCVFEQIQRERSRP